MPPVFFCSLASEEEHEDEEDDDKDDDKEEDEEGGRGVGSEACSPWGQIDDVGGRGTSASGGPSISPVVLGQNIREDIVLTILFK